MKAEGTTLGGDDGIAGAYALGSVGSTSILLTLFLAVPLGMGGGINVLTALAIGSRSKKDVSETIHTAAIISLIAGILLLAFGMFFARDLLTLLNTKEELIEGAVAYLHVYFLGMPAVALYNFGKQYSVRQVTQENRWYICRLQV